MKTKTASEQLSDRRQCLRGLGAAAIITAWHPRTIFAAPTTAPGQAKLREVEILTSTSLDEMRGFYVGKLGLRELDRGPERLALHAGTSRLVFRHRADTDATYHFAFNIPEDRILAARQWQLDRSPLIEPPKNLRDADMPEDVVFFRNWNAHSVFFWDPAGNVVEHIARHTLATPRVGREPFSAREILCVSEIALVSDDVERTAEELHDRLGLATYRPPSSAFAALGDEEGLVLVMRRGRPAAFGQGPGREVFAVHIRLEQSRTSPYEVQSYPYVLEQE